MTATDTTTKWYCKYCGEEDGEPVNVTSREYQGDSPHGGMVEWHDEMCTLCAPRGRDDV